MLFRSSSIRGGLGTTRCLSRARSIDWHHFSHAYPFEQTYQKALACFGPATYNLCNRLIVCQNFYQYVFETFENKRRKVMQLSRFPRLHFAHLPTPLEPMERRSEEHTSELQSRGHLVCRLL